MNRPSIHVYHARMFSSHIQRLLLLGGLLSVSACGKPFVERIRPLPNEELYRVALNEFQRENWDNAIQAFERLTLNLPARDSLLPRSYWYLGLVHERKGEHLLAAQTFTRLTESFPTDTLADDALLRAGRAYASLWRKPELDAGYAQTALSTLQTLQAVYPDSDLRDDAEREIQRLLEWLAQKDYQTGLFYLRRKAYDPAIIYFRDVIERYPTTPTVRDAYLRLVEAYRAINYQEEANETCAAVGQAYPRDQAVRELCGESAAAETVARPAP